MELWLIGLSIGIGVIIGGFFVDLAQRSKIKKDLEGARQELKESAAKLGQLHNELSAKVLEMEDRMMAHEYQISGNINKPKWAREKTQ